MLTHFQMQQAINNLNILIEHYNHSAFSFSFANDRITKNLLFKSKQENVNLMKSYLQKLIHEVSVTHNSALYNTLFITLQNFLHLHPNRVLDDLNLDLNNKEFLRRKNLKLKRLGHFQSENQFKNHLQQHALPEIQYDMRTGFYTSPDDDKAHQHNAEAKRIFLSTQWERFKGLLNSIFSSIGIYVFETTRYKEHDYLDSDIYANDSAIKPWENTASHYWIGHASNLLTIPTKTSPLHVVTDPVEGDLFPLLYPRMTEEGNLIEGIGNKRLPKIDVVVISHNHHDHVSPSTLKKILKQQPKMIVPEGDEQLFLNLGFTDVVGLKWWEQATIADNEGNELLRVTAVPARHWSGRSINDAHRSAFNGYVLHSNCMDGDVYFAGDTALMDDAISDPIFKQFNIVSSIQPGGPDERREDMESTHQSSADGILMHFKILANHYKKIKNENRSLTFENFLKETQQIKTFYNHTATFKLGNLRLGDTFYSYQRMIAAFLECPQWRADHLPSHEQKVYDQIQNLVSTMEFAGETQLNNHQIADIIQKAVPIPQIGQRQPLYFKEQRPEIVNPFQSRSLITNSRALIEFDTLLQDYIIQQKDAFNVNHFILKCIQAYQSPWHAFFSRTYHVNKNYELDIKACQNNEELLNVLNKMEKDLGKRNQHGHMQSLIHYAKWIVTVFHFHKEDGLRKLQEYFACQKVRKLINQEIHQSRSDAKLQAFKTLSNLLTKLSHDTTEYQKIVAYWLKKPANDEQTTQQLLSTNRSSLFAQPVTHSEAIVESINTILKAGKTSL